MSLGTPVARAASRNLSRCTGSTLARSFETNDEISIFRKYLARAEEIQPDAWKRCGWGHKLKDHGFCVLSEVL